MNWCCVCVRWHHGKRTADTPAQVWKVVVFWMGIDCPVSLYLLTVIMVCFEGAACCFVGFWCSALCGQWIESLSLSVICRLMLRPFFLSLFTFLNAPFFYILFCLFASKHPFWIISPQSLSLSLSHQFLFDARRPPPELLSLLHDHALRAMYI